MADELDGEPGPDGLATIDGEKDALEDLEKGRPFDLLDQVEAQEDSAAWQDPTEYAVS